MMDKNSPGFGTHCMAYSMNFGNQILDKIVLSYNLNMVLPTRKRPCSACAFQEFRYGNILQLHIGGELINPWIPMVSAVYQSLSSLVMKDRYFTKAVRTALEPFYTTPCTNDDLIRFVSMLEILGFTFGQLELSFDIGPRPVLEKFPSRIVGGTHYSLDYSEKPREMKENAFGPQRKDKYHSILCIYDRALKLGVGRGVYRLEIRIKQNRRSLLELSDLFMNMNQFILTKGPRINAIVSKYVPVMDDVLGESVLWKFPMLCHLIPTRQGQINSLAATNS